jgi:biopolymer transport protein ExbB
MGMALVIYHFLILKEKSAIPAHLVARIRELVEEEKYKDAVLTCERNPVYITNILKIGIEKAGSPYVVLKEAFLDAGMRETARMRSGIVYLSMIAVLSPMLGLLGTVLGMMQAFGSIAYEAAMGKPELLAGGIAKALVTTAAGLFVGIPSMGFYYYFRAKTIGIAVKAQEISSMFLMKLAIRR